MQYKSVIFDLYETLITEWGHKTYTKNELCADLNISRGDFLRAEEPMDVVNIILK